MKTQFDKLITMLSDGAFHCQADFWVVSKSPHKRRDDLTKRGYQFEERPCTHGIRNSKDFRLASLPKPEKRRQVVELQEDGSVRVSYQPA